MPDLPARDRPDLDSGLCGVCRHVRRIRSDRGSLFYQCQRSRTDSSFPPYPRLPMMSCRGFEPNAAEPDLDTPDR